MGKKLADLSKAELWHLFPVILEEHNPKWKDFFQTETLKIKEAFSSNLARVSHIGSTSVEGLIAKPSIDILVEINSLKNLEENFNLLNEKGWYSCGSSPYSQSFFFIKGYDAEKGVVGQAYHLRIKEQGDWPELYFRDYLKEFPLVSQKYANLKKKISLEYREDRDKYFEAKTQFVSEYSQKAKIKFKDRYK